MLEEIVNPHNIQKAIKQVVSNKGAAGIDGMPTNALQTHLNENWLELREAILTSTYHPKAVRKVEIPKPDGSKRMLGIPTVIDRMLQQAIYQWLSHKYESEFSEYSYGFRENKNAHQAIMQAKAYLNEGKTWVIELDLEKFFDRVNHDKLMGLLVKKITDKRTLKLIRNYLRSGIMEEGVVSPRTEGTPQGSPLSPLLSNIILNELDKELQTRGHSFVRYADDCSIYVGSEKAAQRAMASIINYIEQNLKLKVNREKTKISRPYQSTLLGFSFRNDKDGWTPTISSRSLKRITYKIRAITKRNDPTSMQDKVKKLEAIITGWVNYFTIAKAKRKMRVLDELLRNRLRMGFWKQWKKPSSKIRNLINLGVAKRKAYQWGNSSLGYCRVSNSPILKTALNNRFLQTLGFTGFEKRYYWKTAYQTTLF